MSSFWKNKKIENIDYYSFINLINIQRLKDKKN